MKIQTSAAVTFALLSSTCLTGWSEAKAQVVQEAPVAPADDRTDLDVTPSGTPIVDIAAPNADGTSHNVYNRLDVGREGLIFNNSRTITNSNIGGRVLANANLIGAGRTADLILNEVISGNRSDLLGLIEITGDRAGLIIANPAGITCNGCGFINVSRATLATGRATFSGGNFDGLSVRGGTVVIEGGGVLAGDADYFDIVTGSARLNADLVAQNLLVSAGSSDFDYANREAESRGAVGASFAIDSTLFGGIYANTIRLIGTDAGVGVNLQGVAEAYGGGIAISAEGSVRVRSLVSAGNISVRSADSSVTVAEEITSDQSIAISAGSDIFLSDNTSALAANLNSYLTAFEFTDFEPDFSHGDLFQTARSTYQLPSISYTAPVLVGATIDANDAIYLSAGRNISNRDQGLILGDTIIAEAQNDILIGGGSVVAGIDISLNAGRDLSLETISRTLTDQENLYFGKNRYSRTRTSSLSVTGAEIDAIGNLFVNVGRDALFETTLINVDGAISFAAGRDVAIAGVGSTATTTESWKTSKRYSGSSIEHVSNYDGSSISAGAGITIGAAEEFELIGSMLGTDASLRIAAVDGTAAFVGSDITALHDILVSAQDIELVGSLNSSSFEETTRRVKRKLFSKKTTTTVSQNAIETIFASTAAAENVLFASQGDLTILDSNIIGENAVDLLAGGSIWVGSQPATLNFYDSIRVKKSGFSLGGGGLFLGVSKTSSINTLDLVTHGGSLIGAANGDVTISAGISGLRSSATTESGNLLIQGSEIAAPGIVSLSADNVIIENNIDTADATSLFRSSSFGISITPYENISGVFNSVTGLPSAIDNAGQGPAGTAISAASETLRTVAAVLDGLTNTVGITASVGFSSSRQYSESQEAGVVASTIVGGTVDISAVGSSNADQGVLLVSGSDITAINNLSLSSTSDAIFTSAQDTLTISNSSSSNGIGIGFTLGAGILNGVNASAFINIGASRSSGTFSDLAQFNTQIISDGALSLVTGRDTQLTGATLQGFDVDIDVGRNLLVESLQDVSSGSNNSSGFNLGLTFGAGVGLGFNAGINYSYGTSASGIVGEQSSLIARGGTLDANVAAATEVTGGIIAALNDDGSDSGLLTLRTGSLTVSDIADASTSTNYGIGIYANFNNPFEQELAFSNFPVFDGYYNNTVFNQNTRATIGQGQIISGNGVPTTLNRDVSASQVVTRDSSTGFSVYVDVAAANELYNLVDGLANNTVEDSLILQGVQAIRNNPLGLANSVINEIDAIFINPDSPDSFRESQFHRLFDELGVAILGEERQRSRFKQALVDRFGARFRSNNERIRSGEIVVRDDAGNVLPALTDAELDQAITDFADGPAETFAAVAARQHRMLGRPLDTTRAASVSVGNIAPDGSFVEAPTGSTADNESTGPSDDDVIVVTGFRDSRTGLVRDATTSLGDYYNTGGSVRQRLIELSADTLSGGPVATLVGEATAPIISALIPDAAEEALAGGLEAVNVGVDSFFQSRDFSPVAEENAAENNNRQSFNGVTGTGLVLRAIPGGAVVNRLIGRRGPRPNNRCSFDGGTLVRTMDGFTAIRDIRAGVDMVWARNAVTGQMGYKAVQAQYSNPYDVTVTITIRDVETGAVQTLISNKIHPIFVQLPEGVAAPASSEGHLYKGQIERGAWVDASNLKEGYRLLNDDGSWAEVQSVSVESKPLTAYNLTVDGYHTYFVTGSADAEPVWVHNNCFTFSPAQAAAARRLGINPSDVTLNGGVATVRIRTARKLNPEDIASIRQVLSSQGASSVVINSGRVVNTKLARLLGQLADTGRPFHGLTVIRTGNPQNQFVLQGPTG